MEVENQAPVESTGTEFTQENGTPETVQPEMTYANGKYKSVSDLEKGYINLQQKLGGHIGAPEQYTFNEGLEISEDNPLYAGVQEVGKQFGLSNDTVNALVEMYNTTLAQENEAYEANIKQEMAKLGENGQERIRNILDWSKANLSEEETGLLQSFSQSAEAVQLIEKFIGMSKPQGVARDHQVAKAPTYDADKLNAMRYEKDANGNRRMSTDEAFRKKVLELEAQFLIKS